MGTHLDNVECINQVLANDLRVSQIQICYDISTIGLTSEETACSVLLSTSWWPYPDSNSLARQVAELQDGYAYFAYCQLENTRIQLSLLPVEFGVYHQHEYKTHGSASQPL